MRKGTFLLLAALSAATLCGKLTLDPIFSDNMVLQRGKPIPFFGVGDPGATVTVDFAGEKRSATADKDGQWRVEFPARKADGHPLAIRVTDGKDELKLDNVLMGEVWFCSGQSNMYMRIGQKYIPNSTIFDAEKVVAAADHPQIRFFFQRRVISHGAFLPARSESKFGNWLVCTPKTAQDFSAVGYFFGRKIHEDLKVPVGLIKAAEGGTPTWAWISEDGIRTAGLREESAKLDQFNFTPEKKAAFEKEVKQRFATRMRQWHRFFAAAGAAAREASAGWFAENLDESGWIPASAVSRNHGVYTVRWYRMKFRLYSWMRGRTLRFSMPKGGEALEVFINGKSVAKFAADAPEESKSLDLDLPAELFHADGENTIAVRAEYFYRGADRQQMINLLERTKLAVGTKAMVIRRAWKQRDEFVTDTKKLRRRVPDFISIPYLEDRFPANLYNGMVEPWTRFPIRGVLWYQGEFGAGNPRHYLQLKALIADWRKQWHDPEMPFLIVQLAGFGPERKNDWRTFVEPAPRYAVTRDCQQQMLKLPRVGLATAIDIGEVGHIHPGNKKEVGRRLALEAERIVYGQNVISRGPLFREAKVENGTIRVFFDNAETGLKTSDGKAPGAFFIAGKDGKFVVAEAKIDGDTVVVRSGAVPEPAFVRYAFVSYRGDCNLQNGAGLPAYPFRSDAFDFSQVKP